VHSYCKGRSRSGSKKGGGALLLRDINREVGTGYTALVEGEKSRVRLGGDVVLKVQRQK